MTRDDASKNYCEREKIRAFEAAGELIKTGRVNGKITQRRIASAHNVQVDYMMAAYNLLTTGFKIEAVRGLQ